MRDELLYVEQFSCLAEAQVVIGDWRIDYNHYRPHSSLGMRAPAAFVANLREGPAGLEGNPGWGEANERPGSSTVTSTRAVAATPAGQTARSG